MNKYHYGHWLFYVQVASWKVWRKSNFAQFRIEHTYGQLYCMYVQGITVEIPTLEPEWWEHDCPVACFITH